MKKNKESFFWTSYSDLMTSLFFVMLVLVVLAIAVMQYSNDRNNKEIRGLVEQLQRQKIEAENLKNEAERLRAKAEGDLIVKENLLRKIKELNESIKDIDDDFFSYDEQFKRHTLKNINVSFRSNSSNINDIPMSDRVKLLDAERAIKSFINNSKIPNAQYLVIVEGQSSKDNYHRNYELSYERALSLVKYWSANEIYFDAMDNCEIIISGSGQSSKFRNQPDISQNKSNQRFVIHIIPKPGVIEIE